MEEKIIKKYNNNNNIDTKKKKNFVCLFVCLRRGLTYIDRKYHFPFNNQQEEIFDLVL